MHLSSVVAGLLLALTASATPSSHGSCKTPAVRKEWRTLGYAGQKAYADAIKCLSALPHDPSLRPTNLTAGLQPLIKNSSRYDDVVYTHMDAVDTAHFTGRFLAWHRLYLHTVEGLLKSQCGYSGYIPYWDWTLDAADIKNSPIFNADPIVGLGVFPNATSNYALTTGAFRNVIRTYPETHHIQRNYTLRPFEAAIFPWTFNIPGKEANVTQTASEYHKIVTSFKGNYTAFQEYLDGFRAEGLHNAAHLSLGGDMANVSHSPNDPLFFLLHGNLDRVWAAWQANDPANQYAIGGGEKQRLDDFDTYPAGSAPAVTKDTKLLMANLGPDAKVSDVFDTKGGYLCYTYATL